MFDDKYLWCLTQDFRIYSDEVYTLKIIEDKEIGIHCTILKERDSEDSLPVVYVMFRGTELKLNDILVDMLFFRKRIRKKKVGITGEIRVHSGFYLAVDSIYNKLFSYITRNYLHKGKLIIFGHSAGAAESKEFARRLLVDGIELNKLKLVTFGTPRTGNKYYANWFDEYDMIEYLTKGDVIGMVPFRWMGYEHTRHIKKIGKWYSGHHIYGRFL